jgi:hypothetical protein
VDPDQALRDLRAALRDWHRSHPQDRLDALRDVATAAEALDDWISDGGFLPTDWSAKQVRS